jgi:hypothetical protein
VRHARQDITATLEAQFLEIVQTQPEVLAAQRRGGVSRESDWLLPQGGAAGDGALRNDRSVGSAPERIGVTFRHLGRDPAQGAGA